MKDEGITLGTIMDHMRGMETRLTIRIDGLDGRMDGLEQRMDRMEKNLTRQIDAIDKRLDAIEIENLPKRVKCIEEHLQLAA